ncbi:hypothetical protein CQ059_01725 [Brucella pseudogrignonensis]|nr:hypothetical protein [Ochrobactrum sp. MYb237]PQZ42711.1 hypothetical protein CQ059_01725 [Brucella pseudogrignonensis]PRA42140.1 hypothetical protein CQ063_09090 [Brucella pseudogrignonensis]PRA70433.1 hypothetical protein CQ055_05905 [Brucella pseudogrignonensis]
MGIHVEPDRKDWNIKGKSIRDLIKELESFDDQGLIVKISIDGGKTVKPISLIGKVNGECVLLNLE